MKTIGLGDRQSGEVSTHPSLGPKPNPNPAPTQTLYLTQGGTYIDLGKVPSFPSVCMLGKENPTAESTNNEQESGTGEKEWAGLNLWVSHLKFCNNIDIS